MPLSESDRHLAKMNFGHVQLPREVQEAIDEDRLVIFAGAGVSCPPPSNLPLFNKLAQIICDDDIRDGREDRMLGEKYRSGTDIYAACAKELHGAHTSHTDLHENILKLFKKGSSVRIVTTNFDSHFSTAAKKVYRTEQPKEYHAPALPLGDDFHGIVYLHGAIAEDASKLVLTDRDFGEAYLTRGWAKNFLVDLFSTYTVLFVGYSHNDVTTTYLARGLNPSTTQKRWALRPHDATNEELRDWQHLDIYVMPYPLNPTNAQNPHSRLSDFFFEWAIHRKSRLVSKAKEAKKLGSGLPPESASEEGFIEHCFHDKDLCHIFLSAIKHPAWFSWLEGNQYFDVFFSEDTAILGDSDRVIAGWLVGFVRLKYPYLLFDIIRRNNHRINVEFANILAHSIWVNSKKKKDKHFAKWINLLISCGKLRASSSFTTYLLNECTLPKDRDIALQLFEITTKPKLVLEENFSYKNSGENNSTGKSLARETGFKIGFPGNVHWLIKAWKNVLAPHLEQIAEPLLRLCEKQVYDTYSLQSSIYGSKISHDSFNWDRSSIASHKQDAHPLYPSFSCLVDILRDILKHLLTSNYPRAKSLRDMWWSSKIPIFKRLSIFSYSIDDSITPDEAIVWLISNDLIFRSGMKKEVFDVLAKSYGTSSTKVRKRLLRRIARGYNEPGAKKLSPDSLDYEKYNVLIWLKRYVTNCQLLNEALKQIKTKQPDFSEREHPEFDHWIGSGGFVDPSDGFDFDKILSNSPNEFIESLKSSREDSFKRDRWSHLSVLKPLFDKNQDWGCEFIRLLSKEEGISIDTWNSVLIAFREVPKNPDDWKWLLELLEELPLESEIYSGIAYLISHSIWNKESKPSSEDLYRAALLMKKAWKLSSQNAETIKSVNRDWLTTAINHVGGWIGEFWVHYCSHLYNHDRKNWKGIPKEIKCILIEAVDGYTSTQVNARIALTPWIGYWYTWDSDFSRDVFLPMLDWSRDPVTAQQTWSVLLNYNRGTSPDLEQTLIPYYREFADKVSDLLRETVDNTEKFDNQALRHFGFKIAAITTIEGTNPIRSDFINKFFSAMPEASRVGFAIWIERFLKGSRVDKVRLWDLWLREYVELRLMGMPIPLSPNEGNHMLEWCLHLEPVFSDAVERLTTVPLKKVFAYSIVKDLASNLMADNEPFHACKLSNVALENEDYPHLHKELPDLHKRWKPTIGRTEEFEKFEEHLFRRGWKG